MWKHALLRCAPLSAGSIITNPALITIINFYTLAGEEFGGMMQAVERQAEPYKAFLHRRAHLWLAIVVIFALPLVTWYAWYPQAGYDEWTVRAAVIANLLVGAGLIQVFQLGWRRVGLDGEHLLKAALLIGLVYGLLLLLGMALNRLFAAGLPLFREGYRLDGFLEGWFLTGLGEELLFCGVLYTLMVMRLSPRRRWMAVAGVALLFALWHLPGYLAQHRSGGDLFVRLAINAVSWGFFGAIYALSGNLWLAAFAHASTDYALLPMVTEVPMMGFVFMLLLTGAAWASAGDGFIQWLRGFNKRVTNPLTLTFAGRRVYAKIYHVGRRSGRAYATPVVAMLQGETFFIPLPYGDGVDWCQNVLRAQECQVMWCGETYRAVEPEVVQPAAALPAFPAWLRPLLRHTHIYLRLKRLPAGVR